MNFNDDPIQGILFKQQEQIHDLKRRLEILETREKPPAASEKSWAFKSRDATNGINYIGGFYKFGASSNDFNPSITFGTPNVAYGAHFFVVQAAGGGRGDGYRRARDRHFHH